MAIRGFRDALASIVPRWLSNRRGFTVGYKILWGSNAAILDLLVQYVTEGLAAWMPGRGTVTALPFIGRSRGILQGEAESTDSFAARLRAWLDTWAQAGSSEILAGEIQAYLGNTPTVRIVDRSGFWVMLDPSGNITTATATWNWDGNSNPERAGYWSDLWIIIYADEWTRYASFTDAAWLAAWGAAPGFGAGHEVPRAAVDAILTLVERWKGAHTWVQAILFTTDAATLKPGGINPDGFWGYWSKIVNGVAVAARKLPSPHDTAVRTWIPATG